MSDNGVILADIIATELELESDRVALYGNDLTPPKDKGLFIVISKRPQVKIIGSKSKLDVKTNEEVKSLSLQEKFDIEITSVNTDALLRAPEVVMSFNSIYSIRQQEDNCIQIMRSGNLIDLTGIDGGSTLYRFRQSCTINSVITKRTSTNLIITKFPNPEDKEEA